MIEVIKQLVETIEWCHGGEPVGTADAIKAGKKLIAELESQEPVVTVPRRLAFNTWAFLAQDCSPCAHEECQIGLKNVGVDTLTDAWNKQLAVNTHPPQRKPLTDTEVSLVAHNEDPGDWNSLDFRECWHEGFVVGFRAAEECHKIGV